MVLHHISQRAGALIVPSPVFDPELLTSRDLDMINITVVPQILEKSIRKSEHHNVLGRFFAQIMVDAEGVLLSEPVVDHTVKPLPLLEVISERFVNNDSGP